MPRTPAFQAGKHGKIPWLTRFCFNEDILKISTGQKPIKIVSFTRDKKRERKAVHLVLGPH
jgi:hypothetical protein